MMKHKLLFLLTLCFTILLNACTDINLDGFSLNNNDSNFTIEFIDVGQGDSALIECDGKFMLIDGGDKSASDKVYNVLNEKGIYSLEILAISHLHQDHYGGLIDGLKATTKIEKTISNKDYLSNDLFIELNTELVANKTSITIPNIGDKFKLGSAEIEVIDNSSTEDNDSLVLLITYGKTRFLFTGDIEDSAQKRISETYTNDKDEPYSIDLIKMPHHGANSNSLYQFIRTFMPTYAVISVGKSNQYGHPSRETLDKLNDADIQVYRTDESGNITVKSDGKKLYFETEK